MTDFTAEAKTWSSAPYDGDGSHRSDGTRVAMVHRVGIGEIDASRRRQFLDELRRFVAQDVIEADHPVDTVVLDFSDVTFLDPAGVAAVIRFRAGLNGLGLRLRIVGASRPVEEAISVLGLGVRLGLDPGHGWPAPRLEDCPIPTA